jgi:sec-independent protein translocase protein TatA
MGPIGPLELGIVLLIVLLVFGPKRLPGLGKQLGSGMREFKDGITGNSKDDDDEEKPPQISSAPAEPTQAKAETEDAVTRS